MDNKEYFVKQVQIQLPPELESSFSDVPEVVTMLAKIGLINYNYPKQDVKKVIQFLPRWFIHRKSKAASSIIEGEISAHTLLTVDALTELLKPEIRAIRKAYFGSQDPPFSSLEAAIKWYMPIQDELIRSTYDIVELGYLPRDLEYTTEAAERWWYEVEKPLLALSREVGIQQESLIFYILADIKPLTAPYVITMPGKEYCKGRRKCFYVDIKINTELTFEDLLTIYNTVKEALGVKKGKRLNERHLELHTMVKERGGVSMGKGSVKFWQSLLEEWDGRHQGMYREWRCIKRAYDRLCKKLNTQYLAEEVKDNKAAE